MAPLAARRLAELVALGGPRGRDRARRRVAGGRAARRGGRWARGTARAHGAGARAGAGPRRGRAAAAGPRAGGRARPLGGSVAVTSFDVHRHLWPDRLVEALRSGTGPVPARRGARTVEGAFELDPAADGLEAAWPRSTARASTSASCRARRRSGWNCCPGERAELAPGVGGGRARGRWRRPAAGCWRSRPAAARRLRRRLVGAALADLGRARARARRARSPRVLPLRPSRAATAPPDRARLVGAARRLHRAAAGRLRRLARRRTERWPGSRSSSRCSREARRSSSSGSRARRRRSLGARPEHVPGHGHVRPPCARAVPRDARRAPAAVRKRRAGARPRRDLRAVGGFGHSVSDKI